MIESDRFPYLDVVLTIGTWSLVEAFYVDTGFEGGLLIPEYLRHEVLANPEWIPLRMPNGPIVRAPSWTGTVEIADRPFATEVAAMGSRFLLGRLITDQLLVCFEYGRRLTFSFAD
jgi:hypothetical protein